MKMNFEATLMGLEYVEINRFDIQIEKLTRKANHYARNEAHYFILIPINRTPPELFVRNLVYNL